MLNTTETNQINSYIYIHSPRTENSLKETQHLYLGFGSLSAGCQSLPSVALKPYKAELQICPQIFPVGKGFQERQIPLFVELDFYL